MVRDGRQVHKGIEFTVSGKATDNLSLYGGFTFLNAKMTKNTNQALLNKKPVNVAGKMAKLFAEYDLPAIEGLSLNAGASYIGSMYADNANEDKLPAVTLFDAGASYAFKIRDIPTKLSLSVHNLADKKYWQNSIFLGEPRSFLLTAQFDLR
jgi:iron complex outermembrane receptor protein